MAIASLKEYLAAARLRKELLKIEAAKVNEQTVDNYMEQVQDISKRSEELGATRERIRILNELTGTGPTGEFFEMPWEQLLAIITNAPRGRA